MILLAAAQPGAASPVAEYLKITSDVNNGYAISTVEEKLSNPADLAVQDRFEFRIPEEAFISGFSLTIDGKEYRASVLPRGKASEKFETAASEGRTAGLLETEDENLFAYALNFEPGQSITVKLTYEQALKKTLGEYELVQFLESSHAANDFSITVNINAANQLARLEVPDFPETEVKYLSANSGQVWYEADSIPSSELRVVFETANPPLNGNMLFYESGDQGYLMHIFSPSEEDLGTTALSKEIIFVLDKSGSMEGYKIEQVKEVFGDIIEDLPPGDSFNIIFFDASVQSYSETLMQAGPEEKAGALEFVNSLEANGGTNINEALLTALGMFSPESERVPIIVFLTDGEPTEGVVSPYAIRQNVKDANTARVSIFSIAFGINDESNYHFLRAMSLENYGTAEWFSPDDNAAEQIGSFYETISTPLITDMDFSYTGGVSETVNTGERNLFAGSDTIVLGKYSPGTGSIRAEVTAGTRTGTRDFSKDFNADPADSNAFIPRLWAYTTIENLMDRIEVEGESENLTAEITDLALEFGFVTPYTSLFVELPKTETPEPADAVNEEVEGEMAMEMPAMEEEVVEEEVMSAPLASQPKPAQDTAYEGVEEESTPGFGIILSLGGLLGVAVLRQRRQG
ncbi:VWA domain-containing protein [Methanosarcina sp. KYL-1]|uniref:VIT domain-containing protein n=1 Tax=Methanosarcina sp. KYL-1 TaxID=2602068 RepID=UPI00210103FB|nr:VIT domain-containing protein [Methanosarcina sp. KYL-1]MCQ1535796.1 VWA domain-containing protein [Methanosarcina sp. KYL-1]